jgi:uncharacterized protein YceH (UPF0502 family)
VLNQLLSDVECRILGALIEKDVTTPDYYPLSLNALVNACNQKSNREPVMDLDENTVREGLSSLGDKRLAGPTSSADSRVTKYEHRMQEVFNFKRGETAILCILLLRGPQTPGELRGRTERLHRFEDLSEVQGTLQSLIQREPPLVKVLPRQPGTKEARYIHLFSGDVATCENLGTPEAHSRGHVTTSSDDERFSILEVEIASLRQEISELKQQVSEFKKLLE